MARRLISYARGFASLGIRRLALNLKQSENVHETVQNRHRRFKAFGQRIAYSKASSEQSEKSIQYKGRRGWEDASEKPKERE